MCLSYINPSKALSNKTPRTVYHNISQYITGSCLGLVVVDFGGLVCLFFQDSGE